MSAQAKTISKVYRLTSYVGGRSRNLGTFFVAGSDAPPLIRGQQIFYRHVSDDNALFMRDQQTTGLSLVAFKYVKCDGALYVVSRSEETDRHIFAPIDGYSIVRNIGQGVQIHCPLNKAYVVVKMKPLLYPFNCKVIDIKDVEPPEDKVSESVVPGTAATAWHKTGFTPVYRKCGCQFVNGQIYKPCKDHEAQWRGVPKFNQ